MHQHLKSRLWGHIDLILEWWDTPLFEVFSEIDPDIAYDLLVREAVTPEQKRYAAAVRANMKAIQTFNASRVQRVSQQMTDFTKGIIAELAGGTEWDLHRATQVEQAVAAAKQRIDSLVSTDWHSSHTVLAQLSLDGVDKPLEALGLNPGVSPWVVPIKQLEFIDSYLPTLISGVSTTVQMKVRAQLRQALLGKSRADVEERVKELVGSLHPGTPLKPGQVWDGAVKRARAIMRTEMGRVQNLTQTSRATQLAEKFKGVGIKWLHNSSPAPRDNHAALGGTVIYPSKGEKFMVGGTGVDGPHDPDLPASEVVNCKCATVVVYDPTLDQAVAIDNPYIAGDGKDLKGGGLAPTAPAPAPSNRFGLKHPERVVFDAREYDDLPTAVDALSHLFEQTPSGKSIPWPRRRELVAERLKALKPANRFFTVSQYEDLVDDLERTLHASGELAKGKTLWTKHGPAPIQSLKEAELIAERGPFMEAVPVFSEADSADRILKQAEDYLTRMMNHYGAASARAELRGAWPAPSGSLTVARQATSFCEDIRGAYCRAAEAGLRVGHWRPMSIVDVKAAGLKESWAAQYGSGYLTITADSVRLYIGQPMTKAAAKKSVEDGIEWIEKQLTKAGPSGTFWGDAETESLKLTLANMKKLGKEIGGWDDSAESFSSFLTRNGIRAEPQQKFPMWNDSTPQMLCGVLYPMHNSRGMQSLLNHEFGHALDESLPTGRLYGGRAWEKQLASYQRLARKHCHVPSEYALDSAARAGAEWFAENWSAWQKGWEHLCDPAWTKLAKEVGWIE
jgi:hypothetical protein